MLPIPSDVADAEEVYDVGHSTVTYIVDRNGQKRVAWVGSDWSPDEFLEDIRALI
jgi:cytochrome oxidase Cu insertion factor (SCO1/SenC/PrrC family)